MLVDGIARCFCDSYVWRRRFVRFVALCGKQDERQHIIRRTIQFGVFDKTEFIISFSVCLHGSRASIWRFVLNFLFTKFSSHISCAVVAWDGSEQKNVMTVNQLSICFECAERFIQMRTHTHAKLWHHLNEKLCALLFTFAFLCLFSSRKLALICRSVAFQFCIGIINEIDCLHNRPTRIESRKWHRAWHWRWFRCYWGREKTSFVSMRTWVWRRCRYRRRRRKTTPHSNEFISIFIILDLSACLDWKTMTDLQPVIHVDIFFHFIIGRLS